MREVLEEREFPVGELRCLPPSAPPDNTSVRRTQARVKLLNEDSFKDIDIALFSAGRAA